MRLVGNNTSHLLMAIVLKSQHIATSTHGIFSLIMNDGPARYGSLATLMSSSWYAIRANPGLSMVSSFIVSTFFTRLSLAWRRCFLKVMKFSEDDEAIRQLLRMAGLKADDESIKLECINNEKDEGKLELTFFWGDCLLIYLWPQLNYSIAKILLIKHRRRWK